MMDTEAAAIRDKERFKRLEEQIIDMLVDKSLDYRHIVRELDCNYKYSSPEKLEIVRILYDIKKTGLGNKKKLQKLINHYAIEHENMLVLKP